MGKMVDGIWSERYVASLDCLPESARPLILSTLIGSIESRGLAKARRWSMALVVSCASERGL